MIVTRPADPKDIPALAALGDSSFWNAYGGTASDEDIATHIEKYFSAGAIQHEMSLPLVTYLVAHEDEGFSGFAKIREGGPHACTEAATAVEVQQLYVSPDFQRRGVGGILMDSAVEFARDRGVDGIWLSVWSDADWAVAFYEKYGFVKKGTDDFHLESEVHLDYIMWLPIS